MKKIFATIVMFVVILALGGCASTPTSATTSSTTISDTPKEEFSEARQWSDLRKYAEAYVSGDWDGSAKMQEGFSSRRPYAEIDEDGWLEVGYLPKVIPGATVSPSTPKNLVEAYNQGKWAHTEEGDVVWSDDYRTRYEIREDHSFRSDTTYFVVADAPVDGTWYHEKETIAVIASMYDGDDMSLESLVDMRRNGAWDGSLIWCPETNRIAEDDDRWGIVYWDGFESWRNSMGIFPEVGLDPVGISQAYRDSGGLTLAVTSDTIGLYQTDGTIINQTTLAEGEYDGEKAFAAHPLGNSRTTYAYGGGDKVYAVDFDEQTITVAYDNVKFAEYHGESAVVIGYLDSEGGRHVANRDEEQADVDYLWDYFNPASITYHRDSLSARAASDHSRLPDSGSNDPAPETTKSPTIPYSS